MISRRQRLYREVDNEREFQDRKYGGPNHDDELGIEDWVRIIVAHAEKPLDAPEQFRRQMVRVAALAIAAVEVHDRAHCDPMRMNLALHAISGIAANAILHMDEDPSKARELLFKIVDEAQKSFSGDTSSDDRPNG